MDVILPELQWIGKCCYRINDLQTESFREKSEEVPSYIEESCINEEEDEILDIETLPDGRYQLKLPIPKAFFGFIIGAKGSTRHRIEEETRTKLFVPRNDGDVIIKGSNERSVILAKKHLDATIQAGRKKMQLTHFISLPVNSDEIKKNFLRFKAQVMELCPYLDEKLFCPPEKMHLTLETMVLTDNRERNEACQKLKELSAELKSILSGSELRVEVRGLQCFNDDYSEVNVLYAKVNHPALQELADTTSAYFKKTNFVKALDEDFVRVHMTLMKSSKESGKRIPFDARPIFKMYKDFYFGTAVIRTMHLSQIKSKGEDGYYVPSCIIVLPMVLEETCG